ncbi:MAG: radical SAM protein [Candidatus Omnitrophota bacterium]
MIENTCSIEELLAQTTRFPLPLDKEKPRFLLVVPPSPQIPTPGREFLLKTPIEGVSYISTVLKNAGYPVEIIDYRLKNTPVEELLRYNNAVLGIATFIDSFCFLEDFIYAVRAKNKSIPIILGGPFVSSAPEALMKQLPVDYAVLGEGELTILELMEALSNQKINSLGEIPGICYKKDGETVFTLARTQIRDLDILPVLDFNLWPAVIEQPRLESLGFSSSRGCPSGCSFCFKAIPQVRQMTPQRFCEGVSSFVKIHGLGYAYINDLTFIIGRERTLKMCAGLKASGIRWACSTRVENIDQSLLKIMKDSGCQEIWYGFESVDQKVLDANFKKITVAQIKDAVTVTNQAGIKVMGNFIIGLLGETEESLEKMVQFIQTREVIPCSIKYLTPFPGTYIYNHARQEGLIKDEMEYFRSLSRRKVNDAQDEIINCTGLPEEKLRDAFRKIRKISNDRYGPLDWNYD